MKKLLTPVAVLLLAAMMITLLAGCGGKTPITAADFTKAANDAGLSVDDMTDVYTDVIFTGSKMATSSDGWNVVFFTIDTAENAKYYFAVCKSFMEGQKTGAGTAQTTERDNWASYSQTNGGKFMYVCYIDATMVYVDVEDTYKAAVQEFVKGLGY